VIPADHEEFFSALTVPPDLGQIVAGPTSPTGTGPPPRVGPNVRANAPQQGSPNGLFGRSETSIASTGDGQDLVVGFNDAQGFCGPPFGAACTPQSPPGLSGYAFSTDGGLTWTDGGAPPVINHVFTRGDPWLARGGADGTTFFYANIAVHDQTGASLGIGVHRGHFSGSTFTWDDVHTFNSANPNDFYDKEAIAALPGTPDAYVSLTNFIGLCGQPAFGFGQIEVWRTHDGGSTWQGPVVASPDQTFITNPADPKCGTTGVLQQSSSPAIGPNGQVYVGWQFGPTFTPSLSRNAAIKVARSLTAGSSFDTPVTVANINSMRQDVPVGYNRSRINDHPRVAVATTGADKGRVYVAFPSAVAAVGGAPVVACPSGTPTTVTCIGQQLTSIQVFISHSDDQGQTWSTPTALAPAVPATGVKRWWPVVTVQPGGDVDVVYYESQERQATPDPTDIECNVRLSSTLRRVGTVSSLVDTFWTRSRDGGATWSTPVKMTTATSNWCTAVSNVTPNFGDYIGSTTFGNHILATWGDGRFGIPDTFFAAGLAGP
jgi:hypothetical protein